MFKLTKIQNSGVNVPEPQILPKGEVAIVRGAVLVMGGGKVIAAGATTLPTHIALADAKATDATVPTAQINANMVFECPVKEGTPATLVPGAKVCLVQEGGNTIGVNTTTTSGVATVYDTLGAEKIGDKILITFR